MTAKVHVYSYSVLCLGKIHDPVEAIEQWKGHVATFQVENSFSELLGLDGEPIEFEWTIFPGFTAFEILHKIQSDLEGAHIEPEEFSDRITFMSMFNDKDLTRKEMRMLVPRHLTKFSTICIKICERILAIHWTWKRREVVSWVLLQTRWKM